MADLLRYEDAEVIRQATNAELIRSLKAAQMDGGAGVITVNGESCYVQGDLDELGLQFDIKTEEGIFPIYRDVAQKHPECVHRALGTSSEAELQNALDGLRMLDWYDADGMYLGRDAMGLGIRDADANEQAHRRMQERASELKRTWIPF